MNVVLQKTSALEATGQFLAASKIKKVGFEPGQLSVAQFGR